MPARNWAGVVSRRVAAFKGLLQTPLAPNAGDGSTVSQFTMLAPSGCVRLPLPALV